MKSYITHAIAVYEGVLKDAAIRWPALRVSFEKDLSYLRRAVEARGLPFLTVVLPAMGKVLDKSLDQRCLPSLPVPQGYPMSRKGPKLFSGLFKQIFDESGDMLGDYPDDVDAIAFLRQLLYMAKKMRIECSDKIKKETLHEFFKIESGLPPIAEDTWGSKNPKWRLLCDHPLKGDVHGSLKGVTLFSESDLPSSGISRRNWDGLRHIARRFISELGEPDWWNISPRHGPGAVFEPTKESSKYDFPNWSERLESQFPFDWFGSGVLDHAVVSPETYPAVRELPSKLHMVLKDFNGPRLICAEPLSNAWIQQGIRNWMEDRFASTFIGRSIDLRNQQRSKSAALDASLGVSMATIDLSSASDRLSARLVEYIFQGSTLLDGFNACRTQVVYQDHDPALGSHLALRKFSTQGSALTMPVQSLVYLILTVFAIKLDKCNVHDTSDVIDIAKSVIVYGDDIIAPSDAFWTINLVFSECGLKVNTDKTYDGHGGFRESCGIQAYGGYDVTYVRILQPYDDSPSLIATTIEVANNLFRAGYWHASKAVLDQVPISERKLLRITGPEDGNFGLLSFTGSDATHLKHVWNSDLQREESISLNVTSKSSNVRGRGYADLTQYFTENPSVSWSGVVIGLDDLKDYKGGQARGVRVRKSRTRVAD